LQDQAPGRLFVEPVSQSASEDELLANENEDDDGNDDVKENGTDTNEEEMVQATAIIFAPYCIERNKVRLFSPHRVDCWSPIPQFDDEVAPKAPKRPVRRVDDFDFQPIHEEEGKAEGKEAIIPEEDEDEESIVSLLSGVMAMWTSEREASKLIKADASPSDRRGCIKTGRRPSPTTAGGNSVSKPRTSVAFDRITIREYERTLGDNPSCTSGPPITIGWICLNSYECALDEYERTKSRRNKRDFYLSAAFRNDLLTQEWGCPEKDIRKARREATYTQYCRGKSAFSGARQRAKEAAAMRKSPPRPHATVGPRPNTSDTAQPQPVQLRHRSSVEIGLRRTRTME
jgi:hypothetical protein